MELTCLNCAGTFEVDDTAPQSGSIRCPTCGQQQPLAQRGAAARPRPPAPAGRTDVSAFRKPLQAFNGLRPQPAGPDATRTAGPSPRTAEATVSVTQQPAEVTPPPDLPPNTEGKWLVRSPTGLVLEFPSSQLLVNWSTVLDNPAPYQVSRGADQWTSLDGFVREVKLGGRATQAFRRVALAEIDPPAAGSAPAASTQFGAAQSTSPRPAAERRVATTAQFQFKLTRTAPRRSRKLLVAGLLAGVAVLGAAAAVLVLKLLG